MALVKFNKRYRDHNLGRIVEPNEEIELTVERAEEVKNDIRSLAKDRQYRQWAGFDYEVVKEDPTNFNDLKKDELYPLLEAEGVDFDKKENKDVLIKKLEDAQTTEKVEDAEPAKEE